MLKYMGAELYKVLHRKYTYIFLVVVLACEALLVSGWVFTNYNGNNFDFAAGAGMLAMMLSAGVYCTILTEDMVFSDQYKFNTLKNEVSYGISRLRIFFGKLLVSCITALVLCVIIVIAYLGMCWLVLPHGAMDQIVNAMEGLGFCLLAALPLWLGAQALVNAIFFLVKSSTVASFLVLGIVMALPQVLQLLGMLVNPFFLEIYNIMLTAPLDLAPRMLGDWAFIGRCFLIGGGWFLVSTLLGLIAFQKREIN